MIKATEKQVRSLYKDRCMKVRITSDGHITFRADNLGSREDRGWREGRYVDEYFVDERGNVHLI